ncbi:MAG: ABC transporter permease [Anaerolineaceae bacterium]
MLTNSKQTDNKKKELLAKIISLITGNFVWVLVILVTIIASIITPVFFSIANLHNLLVTSTVLGLLVLGESIVLLTGNFDNSLEATLMFSAMVAAWLTVDHTYASGLLLNSIWGVLALLVVGALIGAINGFSVGYIGMQPFITTFATTVIITGLSILMTGGAILTPFQKDFTILGRAMVGPLPLSGLVTIGLYVVVHIILKYTPIGRSFYVVGSNLEAAKALGINVKKTQMVAFIIAGVLAAIAGWILGGRLNSASSQMSTGQLFLAYGAAVIGGVKLGGGEGKAFGMFGGVVLISAISTLMNLAQVDPYVIRATTGVVILLAMLVDTIRSGEFLRARN